MHYLAKDSRAASLCGWNPVYRAKNVRIHFNQISVEWKARLFSRECFMTGVLRLFAVSFGTSVEVVVGVEEISIRRKLKATHERETHSEVTGARLTV